MAILGVDGGLMKLARDWLGEPVPMRRAMPGDVALVRNDDTVLLGIVEGHQVLAAGATGVIPLAAVAILLDGIGARDAAPGGKTDA